MSGTRTGTDDLPRHDFDPDLAAAELPTFFRIRQRFPSLRIDDLEAAVGQSLDRAGLPAKIRPGQRVAIAVGSRGIAELPRIIRAVVRFVAETGGEPIIVPAMGSHGGATGEGQKALLASLGIDADSMQCPIESSMETVTAGSLADNAPIQFDAVSSRADHVLLVNRIKPHTRLVGPLQSGLVKMLMVGLGKRAGASLYHQIFPRYDYRLERLARQAVPLLIQAMPITLGLAIVEDAYDQPSWIEAVEPDDFLSREPELLQMADSRMARLPFERADLLIIDRIGKEISGTGMDTNVVGRKTSDKAATEHEWPKVRQIYVRSLSDKTAGNAAGIGIAEYCRGELVRAMNRDVTQINCLTSNHVTAAAIPLHLETDAEVLAAALTQGDGAGRDQVKWMWIPDTLQLSNVACSHAYWTQAGDREDLDVLGSPERLSFDSAGNLVSFD